MTLPNDTKITPDLVKQHGLKPDEYERFVKLLGREPTLTELGICSAMWNEHCSYKSSKKWHRVPKFSVLWRNSLIHRRYARVFVYLRNGSHSTYFKISRHG